jgi:hypothetical protein
MIEPFIKERQYLKAVSPNTLLWYRDSFNSATDSKQTIVQRIADLMQRGVKTNLVYVCRSGHGQEPPQTAAAARFGCSTMH